jgi:hypothetical protein
MLRRLLAACLAVCLAAPAVAVGTAGTAQADAVRDQEVWVLDAMNVQPAWQTSMGHGVTVGLIDSGVNGDVSDLAGSVTSGRDYTGVNTPPSDPHWGVHGTWMASLIAGHGHPAGSTNGIVGIAPQSRILSIRAVTDNGDPGDRHYQHESEAHVQKQLAAAINYAARNHVQVISMSLGYQGASLPVRVAIKNALAQGIVVVASSGNSGDQRSSHGGNAPYSFPADYPGVLGVAAVARSGAPAGFSSNNLSVQVAAPGVRVPAQGRDGQYWLVSGTSPACALTAGVAALIKSRYRSLPPALVDQAITSATRDRPHGGYSEEVGFGTVDAAAALQMAGRLVRDTTTGRGQSASTMFGGGASAIPPIPVSPRGRRHLIIDILLALVCLVVVTGAGFWLMVTRGRAAGPAEPAPEPYGPPAYGGAPAYPPPAAAGANGGYGSPAGYGSPGEYGGPAPGYRGYSTPAGHPVNEGYATPAGYPANWADNAATDPGGGWGYRPPAGYRANGSHGTPADYRPPAVGYGDRPPD